ncbi:MAG: bifunctional phosphoribosylaminoimidazolecarboxamide formyltransferase/IMP cyclohydrolase [Actinomycetota bacterium]|nr:bifunctional phosphoribosylaminoimidazolecarboxamide formyltransferase/IMP cyclohydrolase [Actinomycetota bacterium]
MIERALLSVWDKTGIVEFAHGLRELGVELVASGGTAELLAENDIEVTPVEELTEIPEMLGGRVKTLHPRIHAAILARRDHPDDLAALDEHEIEPFDLVCVAFYPFTQIASRHGVTEADAVEMIDIGGPSMLRAAAKNFAHVAPVCSPARYPELLAELRATGELSAETRRRLASEAFASTAAYETAIATWFLGREAFPDRFIPSFVKVAELSYGENPHQRAAYYAEEGARRHVLSRVEQVHGKQLSFNNLNDLSAARRLLGEFQLPAAVIVKHAGPAGVAVARSIEEAFARAHQADPVSAYGMVLALNRPVPGALGRELATRFVEVVIAPDYEPHALEALRAKPATRVLVDRERRRGDVGERDYKRVIGGLLVQDGDREIDDRTGMEVVCGEVGEAMWGDLLFAWRVAKHVVSNAIVLAKDLQTIGIGGGQTSRVDAIGVALEKAQQHGHDARGAVLASDAFIPFADGPEAALDAGIAALIQPGGAKRDEEVVRAVEEAGAAMVFTHRRHFRH